MAEAGAVRESSPRAQSEDNGKEDAATQKTQDKDDLCPITDKNEKPFRLMDMPPEVRIEIYRACLTRPFDILLSKEPKPIDRQKERESILVGTEGFVDGTMSQESEEEEAILDAQAIQDLAASPTNTNDTSAGGSNVWAARPMRALRSLTRSNMQRRDSGNASINQAPPTFTVSQIPIRRPNRIPINAHTNNPTRGRRSFASSAATEPLLAPPRAPRPQDVDPLLVNLLRASKLIYKESRAILYGENTFLLDLDTAQPTLANLHQRSRGQIKCLRVTIPTHNEILERFAEVVRLSIRYCWRLQRFVIHTPFVLPGAEGSSTSGNTTVYANAFDILRWLPRKCEVVLEGNVCEEIRKVVEKNLDLAKNLDDVSHLNYIGRGQSSSFEHGPLF